MITTMLGLSSTSDRVFVYEVEGLRQNEQTIKNSYPLRNSGNQLIQVPYSRMNEEMLRISRLGGTIVAVHSLADCAAKSEVSSKPDASAKEKGGE